MLLSLTTLVSCSANGAYYECDATALTSNYCSFVATSSTPSAWGGISEHNVAITVGSQNYRQVTNMDGTQLTVSAQPWTNKDALAVTSTKIDNGPNWNYVVIFELAAPMRDKLMYHQQTLQTDSAMWLKYTKAFTDCKIKTVDEAGDNGTAYSTDNLLAYIKDPSNTDIHHYVLQWVEEASIDLVCLVTDLDMTRCTTIRTALGISTGTYCNCWFDAYKDLWGVTSVPVDTSLFTSCHGSLMKFVITLVFVLFGLFM